MKRTAPILLKLAITSGLLWMIFREHRFSMEIWPHLRAMFTHWEWTLAGLACVGITTWLSALRWQILLRGQHQQVSSREVLRITLTSNFFNIASIGALGGDTYRILALMTKPSARKLPLMVSVMLDHILGMVGLGILFLSCRVALMDRLDNLSPEVQAILRGYELFMGASLIMTLLSVISFTPKLYNWGEHRWPRVLGFEPLKKFASACDALRRDWRGSLLATGISVLLFVFHFQSFYCGIHAVGGTAPVLEFLAAMPIVDTAAGLPISVSGLGVREKTFETLVHALTGLPGAMAVSASLAGWLMSMVWGLIGGLVFISGSRATSLDLSTAEAGTP
jgi:uncharacterized membrane protein YbhN (UPF0104 family)